MYLFTNTFKFFNSETHFKEKFFAALSITYLTGYLSWSFYAWNNNLGVVTAFNLQYFLSGLIPFCIILQAVLLFNYAEKLNAGITEECRRHFKGIKLLTTCILIIFPAATCVRFIYIYYFNGAPGVAGFDHTLTALGMLSANFGLLIQADIFKPTDLGSWSRLPDAQKKSVKLLLLLRIFKQGRLGIFFIRILTLLLLYPVLKVYYENIYPRIPQELGGVKPKRCIIMSKNPDVSIRRNPAVNNSRSYTSDILLVYYYSNDKIIAKLDEDDDRVYELDRGEIKRITWLKD